MDLDSANVKLADEVEATSDAELRYKRTFNNMAALSRAFVIATHAAQAQKIARFAARTALIAAERQVKAQAKELAAAAAQIALKQDQVHGLKHEVGQLDANFGRQLERLKDMDSGLMVEKEKTEKVRGELHVVKATLSDTKEKLGSSLLVCVKATTHITGACS